MKKQPYSEIIDLTIERKEYSLLCRGKSEKYRYYTDWEDHITECVKKLPSKKDLDNFKHFCINAQRSISKAPELYVSYTLLLITVFIDEWLKNVPSYFWFLPFVGILCYAIVQNKILLKESYFFEDVIKIIEKTEVTRAEGDADEWIQ